MHLFVFPQFREKAEHYVAVYRCFHGNDPDDYHLKRGSVDSLRDRDDGTEIYFVQQFSRQCKPYWDGAMQEKDQVVMPSIRAKGELLPCACA